VKLGWTAYCAAWLTFALFWSLAASMSSGRSPADTLPYGLVAMTAAALMGVGVWRLTGHLPLDWRSPRLYLWHGPALITYVIVYAWSWVPLEVARGGGAWEAITYASPSLLWNAMMGSWLYLMVAGAAYAIRGQQAVRTQEAAAADARLLAQQAQLAALRSQVNPHFLFNALHSVGALIELDPHKADQAVERLGDLLRYALNADDEVPLREEWRFTKDYLSFEQLRLGERLAVVERIEDSAAAVFVPPLILQPVVENAIRHGIADRPDGGRIRLDARVEQDTLLVQVADDGDGLGREKGFGVGIASIRRRLHALHGGGAGIETGSDASGFRVTITLPTNSARSRERA
jgi:signal transduction histidine kinase